jgi:hypothetical protein
VRRNERRIKSSSGRVSERQKIEREWYFCNLKFGLLIKLRVNMSLPLQSAKNSFTIPPCKVALFKSVEQNNRLKMQHFLNRLNKVTDLKSASKGDQKNLLCKGES